MSDLPPVKYLDMAAKAAGYSGWSEELDVPMHRSLSTNSIIAHARTLEEADHLREKLAQHEPEPVDPARALVATVLAIYSTGRSPSVSSVDYVLAQKLVQDALAQYKAERPNLSDDEALLIAREICARVCDALELSVRTQRYREGGYDRTREVQFALSMLKRDPVALEAFRKGVDRG